MVDSRLVRIGFLTQLSWRRYGRYWVELALAAGLEPAFADPEAVKEAWQDPDLSGVPTLAFRLAAAQALALADCQAIVVPRLARESGVERGSGQDPWVMDLAARLRSALPGLPTLHAVPAWFDESLESESVTFLQTAIHDAMSVRRALGRVRPLAKAGKAGVPDLARRGGTRTVAVLGRPWVVDADLARLVEGEGERTVGQHLFDPEELRSEGWRADERLVDGDAEVIGAARLLGRRAAVDALRLVVDEEASSDAWLANRVAKVVHKPLEVVTLQAVLTGRDPVDTLLRGPVD